MRSLGTCAHCAGDVVLVETVAGGWRFCWRCDRRGAEVVLVGENPMRLLFAPSVLDGPEEPTAELAPPSELLERARASG